MRSRLSMAALAWLVLSLVPLHISADAIVRSTAMFADTIAEFYVEKDHVRRVLDHVKWNKSKAAEILGIERSTLYSRIKSYGLKQEGQG